MLRNPKLCSQNRRNLPRLPVRKHQSSDLYISTILFLLSLFPIFFLLFHHLQHTFLFYPHTVLIWRVARSSPPDINRNTPGILCAERLNISQFHRQYNKTDLVRLPLFRLRCFCHRAHCLNEVSLCEWQIISKREKQETQPVWRLYFCG